MEKELYMEKRNIMRRHQSHGRFPPGFWCFLGYGLAKGTVYPPSCAGPRDVVSFNLQESGPGRAVKQSGA